MVWWRIFQEDEDEKVAYLITLAQGELQLSETSCLAPSIASLSGGALIVRHVLNVTGDGGTPDSAYLLPPGIRP